MFFDSLSKSRSSLYNIPRGFGDIISSLSIFSIVDHTANKFHEHHFSTRATLLPSRVPGRRCFYRATAFFFKSCTGPF